MKKILLFLTLITLVSCTDVGYLATVEVRTETKTDTIQISYLVSQDNMDMVYGPSLRIKDGNLAKTDYDYIIYRDVKSFSVLEVKKLNDK